MTAKEIREKARSYMVLDSEGYYFDKDKLQAFVNQLCKEQRELCWRELNKKVYMNKDYTKQLTKIVILNTKQPEV